MPDPLWHCSTMLRSMPETGRWAAEFRAQPSCRGSSAFERKIAGRFKTLQEIRLLGAWRSHPCPCSNPGSLLALNGTNSCYAAACTLKLPGASQVDPLAIPWFAGSEYKSQAVSARALKSIARWDSSPGNGWCWFHDETARPGYRVGIGISAGRRLSVCRE